jgi:hypothetical protein
MTALEVINIGTFANDTTGDPIQAAFSKCNFNFNALNTAIGSAQAFVGLQGSILSPTGDQTGFLDTLNLSIAYSRAVSNPTLQPGGSAYGTYAVVAFGPGVYYINQAYAMMPGLTNGPTLKLDGLKFVGAGQSLTIINYSPATPGPLCYNRLIQNVQWEGIFFYGNSATSDFYQSSEQGGLSNIQYFNFSDCGWGGTWQNICLLSGGNNNSEWRFDRCFVTCPNGLANWMYLPQSQTFTVTASNSQLAFTNVNGGFAVGQTLTFGTTVGNIVANTTYFIVAATGSYIQIATSFMGSPLVPNANGTAVGANGTDQFLNFWFTKCKFWSTKAPWIYSYYGGQFNIDDCDVSAFGPTSTTYLFNLLGTPNAQGVQQFRVNGLRVEHATDFALLMNSNWNNGNITFMNLDQSSQVGSRSPSDVLCNFNFVNQPGPIITFRDSQLSGVHNYDNNSNNYNYQSSVRYESCTLLQNNSAANFITVTNSGNKGGYPIARFKNCRNSNNASAVGWHEVVDSDVNWNIGVGGSTDTKVVSFVSANSDWPSNGGSFAIRLPLNAMITRIRWWLPVASGGSGAYNYSIQTEEATPTVLGTVSGSNSATPVPASSMYTVTPNFVMTTDLARTIKVLDTITRTSIFTNFYCLIDYIG